jgi:hypothetical protein
MPMAEASLKITPHESEPQIIAGDAWGTVTLPIIEEYPPTAIFFVI